MKPTAGAAVMGTGIVSVALSLDGDETISRIVLAIAGVMWVTLAVLAGSRAMRDRAGFAADTRTPAALTSVAGTAVLGTGLTGVGWSWAGVASLVVALALFVLLAGPVLANWKTPTLGASLLLTGRPSHWPSWRRHSRSPSMLAGW
ncbi:MAG: SLAC1 family transporter [Solirubrobacteraceae bacterium]